MLCRHSSQRQRDRDGLVRGEGPDPFVIFIFPLILLHKSCGGALCTFFLVLLCARASRLLLFVPLPPLPPLTDCRRILTIIILALPLRRRAIHLRLHSLLSKGLFSNGSRTAVSSETNMASIARNVRPPPNQPQCKSK
jgi:hypothetical protein